MIFGKDRWKRKSLGQPELTLGTKLGRGVHYPQSKEIRTRISQATGTIRFWSSDSACVAGCAGN
jgi:hypothetical protein